MKDINKLINILKQSEKNIYIQPHNIPDPDAIASSFGLQYLLNYYNIDSQICYHNPIEKMNSLKMLELFNINMEQTGKECDLNNEDYIILIDTQKGNSNVTYLTGNEIAVIDHHENLTSNQYQYEDIRPNVGACSSIVAEYFYNNDIIPSTEIATALLYGISMDTNNLVRKVSKLDIDMFYWLYKLSNISLIKLLNHNQIEQKDLICYAKALEKIEVYENIAFVCIDKCNDSLLGTINDMISTISGINITVAYAQRKNGIKFSVRSTLSTVKANELIRYILEDIGVGGGHNEMAGGFIHFEKLCHFKNKNINTYVRFRTISFVSKMKKL